MYDDNLYADINDGLIDECKINEWYKVDLKNRKCIVSRSGTQMRLFVECPADNFGDKFNSVEIYSSAHTQDGIVTRGIELLCDSPITDPFVLMSMDLIRFVEKSGTQLDFQLWCDGWKEIIGNKYSEQLVYDTLAELIVYNYLLTKNYEPAWRGPEGSRHDIICDEFDCEVKSTICRTGALTIETGDLQLLPGSKPLYLYVCQFESSPNGDYSISNLKINLANNGADINALNSMLKKAGLNTTENLNKKFNLLAPIKKYNVDSQFPRLTNSDFVGGERPSHIMNIKYSVILDGLDCEKIIVNNDENHMVFQEQQ